MLRARKRNFFRWTSWILGKPRMLPQSTALVEGVLYAGTNKTILPSHSINHNTMVLLTVTPAAKAAIERYSALRTSDDFADNSGSDLQIEQLSALEIGSPIDHENLIKVSTLLKQCRHRESINNQPWRLDDLLKGASVYQPPPPAKAEPVGFK